MPRRQEEAAGAGRGLSVKAQARQNDAQFGLAR